MFFGNDPEALEQDLGQMNAATFNEYLIDSLGTLFQNATNALPRPTQEEQPAGAHMVQATKPKGLKVLSLFDGLGAAGITLTRILNIPVVRYIAVEIDSVARHVAQIANPRTETFPGVEHGFPQND